jgi:hypothetical protein
MDNWKPWIDEIKNNKFYAVGLLVLLTLPVTLLLVFRSQDTRTSAALPDALEAESGVTSSTGVTKQSDSQASGGQYVKFAKSSSPSPTSAPSTGTGTGGTYKPAYVNVTGGGAMPSTSGGINVQDYGAKGDGVTNDTIAFQNAANAAGTAGKPLLIPKTNAFYNIKGTVTIKSSVIGINGMPKIKQTSGIHGWTGTTFDIAHGLTGWIYNLHMIGEYNGEYFNYRRNYPTYPEPVYPDGEGAHNIRFGGTSGFTVKGNIFENAWGDGINGGRSSTTYPAKNILIDNNTFINAMRCAISATSTQDRWAILNNKIIHASYYVNPFDAEPNEEPTPGANTITNYEIAHNEWQITSPYEVVLFTGWFDPTPGGNVWVYNNYGSWIGEFFKQVGLKGAPSSWYNVNVWNNLETN